jgi:hypothetical protein
MESLQFLFFLLNPCLDQFPKPTVGAVIAGFFEGSNFSLDPGNIVIRKHRGL